MNLNMKSLNSVNKTWRTVGLIALAASVLAYPTVRLVRYAMQRRKDLNAEGETLTTKLFNAYRGKHKPHHRKAESNGHISNGMAKA